MKHTARAWLSLSVWLIGVGCRGATAPQGPAGGLPPDPAGCRSFATLGSVDVGRQTGELRCAFDAASSEHRCEMMAGGERVSSVTEYASLADFIEAGHTVGKATSLGERHVENGETRRTSHHYDELGRLVRSIEETGARRTVIAYADYDAQGRPQRARARSTGEDDCGAWVTQIEYSDALRSVARRSRPEHPERCGFTESTLVERYDGAGHRVQIDTADGAGVARSFVARGASASVRVCL
jgi:YD repeat-containing protein